jgi:hypothetical protein
MIDQSVSAGLPIEIGDALSLFAPYAFTLLAGAVIAYGWTLTLATSSSRLTARLGGGSLLALVTGVPLGILASWKIQVTSGIGFCYLVGTVVSVYIAWRRAISGLCAIAMDLPRPERKKLSALMRHALATRGPSEARNEADKFCNDYRTQRHLEAVEALHDFIHVLRDRAAEFLRKRRRIIDDWLKLHQDKSRMQIELRDLYFESLHHSLPHLVRCFECLVGRDRRLWVSVRAICPVGQKRVYKTLIRFGLPNDDRQKTSADIPEDSGLPAFLRMEHGQGRGIVILGNHYRAGGKWFGTKNDGRKEDTSVMAGPIFAKNEEPSPMTMMLCMSSPIRDVFTDAHKPFLKCAVDTLSMFVTLMAEDAPLVLSVTPLSSDPGRQGI